MKLIRTKGNDETKANDIACAKDPSMETLQEQVVFSTTGKTGVLGI